MTKYIDTPNNILHNKLVKAFPNPEQREWEKDRILKAKEAQRADKIKITVHRKLWRALLNPLKYEISNAKIGMKHEGKFKEERVQAFTAYIAIMKKLLMKFDAMMIKTYEVKKRDGTTVTKPHTPSSIAQEVDIPNKGLHWTDWIPQHKRVEITQLFEQIPRAPKTKKKIPFQRTQRPNTKQRESLLKRTENELANAITEHRINQTEESETLVRRIKEAIKIIETLKPTDVVPRTWHALDQGDEQ